MHTPASPSDRKTLLQVEAYLTYNLDITSTLIESTRTRIESLETDLATPAAAAGKVRKNLKNARWRLIKKLRQCQAEAEVLTRGLDEVKSSLAAHEMATGRRLSVVEQMVGSGFSSPVATGSEKSSSISSYISSGELSSGPAFAYATTQGGLLYSPTALQYPVLHINVPIAHNLPSAPVWPVTPWSANPYMYGYAYPIAWPHTPEFAIAGLAGGGEQTQFAQYHPSELPPAPLTMPTEATMWGFQQSPVSEAHTVLPLAEARKGAAARRYSVGGACVSDSAAELRDSVEGKLGGGFVDGDLPGWERGSRHRRGVSCNIEQLVRGWDVGMS